MKKTHFPHNAIAQKPSFLPPTAGFTELNEDDEGLEAIRDYDSAKVAGETPIPYEQVLRRIKPSQQ
jgi:hypothetical protein